MIIIQNGKFVETTDFKTFIPLKAQESDDNTETSEDETEEDVDVEDSEEDEDSSEEEKSE